MRLIHLCITQLKAGQKGSQDAREVQGVCRVAPRVGCHCRLREREREREREGEREREDSTLNPVS